MLQIGYKVKLKSPLQSNNHWNYEGISVSKGNCKYMRELIE